MTFFLEPCEDYEQHSSVFEEFRINGDVRDDNANYEACVGNISKARAVEFEILTLPRTSGDSLARLACRRTSPAAVHVAKIAWLHRTFLRIEKRRKRARGQSYERHDGQGSI